MSESWPGRPRLRLATIAALITAGTTLRLWQWSLDRSFWIDEATVAIGLLIRPLRQILGAHDFGQISPPGWLALVDLSAATFGPTEMALRLPTLILALCYLPALWLLLRRLVGPRASLLGLALAAFSPSLIEYSSELKPYGADPLVALGILALFMVLVRRQSITAADGAVAGLVLGLTTWFSAAAVVVIAGCLPVFIVTRQARRATCSAGGFAGRALVAGIPAIIFGAVYFLHYRPEPWLAEYLDRFWAQRFWSGAPPRLLDRFWASLMEVVSPVFVGRGGDLFPGVILLLMTLGVWRWLTRARRDAVLIVGPLAVWAVMAVLRLYPVTTRLGLFAVPCLTILLVSGWDVVRDWSDRRWPRGGRYAAAALAVWLVLPPLGAGLWTNRTTLQRREHARPVVEALAKKRQPGDLVYVYARAAPEWLFYTTDWSAPDLERIRLVLDEYRYPDGRTFVSAPPRTTMIQPIGADLRYRYQGGEEIYGLFSGFERASGPRASIDRGWAAVEVDRMLASNPRCLWLVGFHAIPAERDSVRELLGARGFTTVSQIAAGRSWIDEACRSTHAPFLPPSGPGS